MFRHKKIFETFPDNLTNNDGSYLFKFVNCTDHCRNLPSGAYFNDNYGITRQSFVDYCLRNFNLGFRCEYIVFITLLLKQKKATAINFNEFF